MADYFVWPGSPFNGDGSSGAAATSAGGVGAYNTWVGVTLTANNRYFQKRGTTYVGAAVRPQSQVSAAATPLTIGAYANDDGTDDASQPRPIVDHNGGSNGSSAVLVDTCTNVVVQDIIGQNSRGSLSGGVGIRRSVGVRITRCCGRNSEHGIIVRQDQASGTSVATDIDLDGNDCYNNVGGGICVRVGEASTAVIKRMRIRRNRCSVNGQGKNVGAGGSTIPAGGIVWYTFHKSTTAEEYRCKDVNVDDNEVHMNNGYGINVEMIANEARRCTVSRNHVTGSGFSRDIDSHSLWLGNSFGVLLHGNYVHDNFARENWTSGSGVGIFVDFNGVSSSGGANNVVVGNRVERQSTLPSQVLTPGVGIAILFQTDTIVSGNVVADCRNGITVGPTNTSNTSITNNTVLRASQIGIANTNGSSNCVVRNNLVHASGIGLFNHDTSTSGYAESYNWVSECTTPFAAGTVTAPVAGSLDGTDTTDDATEYLQGSGALRMAINATLADPGNPLATAGTYLPGVLLFNGRLRPGWCPVGAYQAELPRAARSA